MRRRKKLGQHFLISSKLANRIINFSRINPDDVVIEVGAGKGALTRQLINKASVVIAIEIDSFYSDYVKNKFSDANNFIIINEDVLKIDIPDVLKQYEVASEVVKIIGNIPFSITSPLIDWLIAQRNNISQATLMIQRELAERLIAQRGEIAYGKLSVIANLYFFRKYGFEVKRNMFRPIPKVDASVIQLTPRDELSLPLEEKNVQLFVEFLSACFGYPRKTLLKNLQLAIGSKKDTNLRKEIMDMMEKLKLSERVRAKDLTLENFYSIYEYLKAKNCYGRKE